MKVTKYTSNSGIIELSEKDYWASSYFYRAAYFKRLHKAHFLLYKFDAAAKLFNNFDFIFKQLKATSVSFILSEEENPDIYDLFEKKSLKGFKIKRIFSTRQFRDYDDYNGRVTYDTYHLCWVTVTKK